jgi:hypothetical protein
MKEPLNCTSAVRRETPITSPELLELRPRPFVGLNPLAEHGASVFIETPERVQQRTRRLSVVRVQAPVAQREP